ncbi:MAG: hypothetical protein JNK64_08495 [Myxococcales bacterium]|nr:hypothetical protein [Myxococcales bacterium]
MTPSNDATVSGRYGLVGLARVADVARLVGAARMAGDVARLVDSVALARFVGVARLVGVARSGAFVTVANTHDFGERHVGHLDVHVGFLTHRGPRP